MQASIELAAFIYCISRFEIGIIRDGHLVPQPGADERVSSAARSNIDSLQGR